MVAIEDPAAVAEVPTDVEGASREPVNEDSAEPVAPPVAPGVIEVKLLGAEPVVVPVAGPVLTRELPLLTGTTSVADVDMADPVAVEP